MVKNEHSNTNRLYRSDKNKALGGVCSGIGVFFDIDPTIVRIIFILLTIFGGSGIFIYIILWILLPSEKSGGYIDKKVIDENIADVKSSAKNLTKNFNIDSSSKNQKTWAILLIFIGLILLLNNLSLINFGSIWPFLLIFIGVLILIRR